MTGILAIAVAGFASHHTAPPARLRPSAVLVLEITGGYRIAMLDDDCVRRCDSVRTAMYPHVRSALSDEYPFIEWNTSAAEPDTIEVRFEDRSVAGDTRITFVHHQSGRALDSGQVAFESIDDIIARNEASWQVAALTTLWRKRLPALVRGSENDLLPRVFGRVPLNAAVDFQGLAAVFVPAHLDTIKAGTPHPIFELTVDVKSATLDIEDVGVTVLDECTQAQGRRGYKCPMRSLSVGNRKFESTDLEQLRTTNAMTWRATRLRSFRPSMSSVTLAGVPQ